MKILSTRKQVSMETSDINYCADVDEKAVATLTLHSNGMVRTCNQAGGELLGFSVREIIGQHITQLLPQLKKFELVQDKLVNPYLRFLSRIGYHFEVVSKSGVCFSSEVFFNDIEYLGRHYLRVIIRPIR